MKVIELIEALNLLDDDTEVIMSKDAEGNAFYALDEVAEQDDGTLVLWPGGAVG